MTRSKVFTIVVLTSGDKRKKDVLITDLDPHDLEGNSISEIPHKIIYLCPKYLNDKTPLAYQEWLQAIEDSLDEKVEETDYHSLMIQKIFQHIEKDLISPQERARMIEEYHLEQSKQDKFIEGHTLGKLEGKREGKLEGKREIARNLLAKGIPLAVVIEATRLTEVEIQALIK